MKLFGKVNKFFIKFKKLSIILLSLKIKLLLTMLKGMLFV